MNNDEDEGNEFTGSFRLPQQLANAASVAGLSERNWDIDDVRAFQEFLDLRHSKASNQSNQQSSSNGHGQSNVAPLVNPLSIFPLNTNNNFNEYYPFDNQFVQQPSSLSNILNNNDHQQQQSPQSSQNQHHQHQPQSIDQSMVNNVNSVNSNVSNDNDSNDKKKFRRSRKGCFTCRSRKIKCDEQRPVCHRCQVAKRECVFPTNSNDNNNDNNKRNLEIEEDRLNNDLNRPGWLKYTTDPPDFLSPFLPSSDFSNFGPRFPPPTFLDVDGNIGPSKLNVVPPPQPDASLSQNISNFANDFNNLETDSHVDMHKNKKQKKQKDNDNNASLSSSTTSSPVIPDPFDALYPPSPFAIPFETKFPTSSNPPDISKLRQDERAINPPRRNAFRLPDGEIESDDDHETDSNEIINNNDNNSSITPSQLSNLLNTSNVTTLTETKSPLLSNPDYLFPFFPNPQDRMLVHHYLTQSVRFIIALNLPHSVNPWIRIHAPLAFGMIADKNPNEAYAQAQVTGQGISVEALRTGLLSVSAVHLAYLRGKDNASRDLAASLRRTAVRYLQKAVSTGEVETDTFLAGVLSVAMRDILAGDPGWKGILELAKSVIQKRGGPSKMLEIGKPKKKKEVSVPRFLLEQLATRDVFGSLTTGEEPAIIKGWSPWFLQLGESGSCDWEWESVERMFGLSRGMVDLIARISSLVARKRKLGLPLFENGKPNFDNNFESGSSTPEFRGRSVIRNNSRSNRQSSCDSDSRSRTRINYRSRNSKNSNRSNNQSRSRSSKRSQSNDVLKEIKRQTLEDEARDILKELEAFATQMMFIQLHPRVSIGNHAHRYAMQIHILRNLFNVPIDDVRVRRATESILEVCFEGSSAGMVVWLTWPVLIAGMHSIDNDQRTSVLSLLQSFKTQACWDVESAEAILKEYWRRLDSGHINLSWMDVMRVCVWI